MSKASTKGYVKELYFVLFILSEIILLFVIQDLYINWNYINGITLSYFLNSWYYFGGELVFLLILTIDMKTVYISFTLLFFILF